MTPIHWYPKYEILRRHLGWMDAGVRFFSALFDQAPDAMLVVDDGGRVHEANRAACSLHAIDRYELVRLRIQDLLPRMLDLRPAARSLRERGEASLEFTEVTADGTETSMRLEGRRFQPRRYVVSFHDVTAEKKLESELERANVEREVGHAAAKVVHDVNNLLAPIICYADALTAQKSLDDDLLTIISEMRAAAQRAAALTRTVLAVGQVAAAQEPTVVRMNEVVAQMKGMLTRLVGAHIALTIELDPELATVVVDREELERLILNVALNARDAMPNGGSLSIETANVERKLEGHPHRYAMLAVTDTGTGMDAKTRERMFEPFFTTKSRLGGTGLGLSTALAFVNRSCGYIEVDSEPGGGTTLRIGLPERPFRE